MHRKHIKEDKCQLDTAHLEEVTDVPDALHVGGELLAVLHAHLKELVEVGKCCLVAGGSVGGTEDGDHFETLADKVVAGVKVYCGVTRYYYVDVGAVSS